MKYVCPKGCECEAKYNSRYCIHKFPHEHIGWMCKGFCDRPDAPEGDIGKCIPYNDIILFKRSKKGGDSDG